MPDPISTETIESRLREMMPQLTEQVAAELRARALRELENTVVHQINQAVAEYIKEALLPTIKDQLARHDAALRAGLQAGIVELATELGKKIIEQGMKKLAAYDGDRLVGDIMKNVYGRGY